MFQAILFDPFLLNLQDFLNVQVFLYIFGLDETERKTVLDSKISLTNLMALKKVKIKQRKLQGAHNLQQKKLNYT